MYRVGLGYDRHALQESRRLIIGGVEIDSPLGLGGHFAGDVLSRAICDALLGAAKLEDLAAAFPVDDPKYADISSLKLLELVKIRLAQSFLQIENIDAVVICPQVDLTAHKSRMAANVARALDVEDEAVSVKISAVDALGIAADGKAIGAAAVCLVSFMTEEDEEPEDEGSGSEY